jgi:hypothetical protein
MCLNDFCADKRNEPNLQRKDVQKSDGSFVKPTNYFISEDQKSEEGVSFSAHDLSWENIKVYQF